jgi:hypothetical protein
MDGIYRIPKMMQIFAHNSLLMSEKGYLIFEKKRDNQVIIPLGGELGINFVDPYWGRLKSFYCLFALSLTVIFILWLMP